MKIGVILSAAALAVAAVAVAAMPVQDAKAKAKPDDKAMAGMAAMEEMWGPAGKLGPQHEAFAKLAGNWDQTVKMYLPGMPPMENKSTATRETILGGRFLVEHVKGDMGPMGPFEGHGMLGYNNLTKQYDHVWTDSMSTGMMISHGTAGADGTITMTGEYDDPAGGKVKTRSVSKMVSDNEEHFEMYETHGSAPEAKTMEITYTRAAR
jgi:Protein of unknown function (DUF1579)